MTTTPKLSWSALTPRERDALVAEKVMLIPAYMIANWSPTTSIADAFVVVRKMRAAGYECDMTTEQSDWTCQFYKLDYSQIFDQTTYTISPSLSEAISKSALRACGVEVGE